MKHFPSSSSNSTFTDNIDKTFDQIVRAYSTLNMQQWICFVKAFYFDQMFE
jgi:hypothetical protein